MKRDIGHHEKHQFTQQSLNREPKSFFQGSFKDYFYECLATLRAKMAAQTIALTYSKKKRVNQLETGGSLEEKVVGDIMMARLITGYVPGTVLSTAQAISF
jgi:hypothetical protein